MQTSHSCIHLDLIISGVLELLEYSPPTVRAEGVKMFEEAQKLEFEKQVLNRSTLLELSPKMLTLTSHTQATSH